MAKILLVFVITLAGIVAVLGADECDGQNEYYSCREKPDNTCESLNQTSVDDEQESDKASDSAQCNAQCYCNPGTARDEDNVCVPYDQCNKTCGPDEIQDNCPVDCPTDNCPKNEQDSVSCPKPTGDCPPPQCKCRFNFRRADTGTCIPTRDCPPFKCEKQFEEYNPCPPICPNGYCTQATPTGLCPAIFGRIGIVLECTPQCRCKRGYFWNEDKICIPYDQCPGKDNSTTTTTPDGT